MRTATALRRAATSTPEHAAAALTQVDLRARAVAKLGDDAARMYFTPEGLEQATRSRVAAHRAARVAMAAARARCSTSAAASAATWSRWRGPG